MNNSGDIVNSAIFLNYGGRGFMRRFGNSNDAGADASGIGPDGAQGQAPVDDYYSKVEKAINETYKQRDTQKQRFIEQFNRDVERQNKPTKEELKKIDDVAKEKEAFIKPLLDARKKTYQDVKRMRYDLTLLENKYHKYILDNIEDLPKKTAALKKAFLYVRNTVLASKEIDAKKKDFYKRQMDDYLKKWSSYNANGNAKLQALRNAYKIDIGIKNFADFAAEIKRRKEAIYDSLNKYNILLYQAEANKDSYDVERYKKTIGDIEKTIKGIEEMNIVIGKKEKDVSQYIQTVNQVHQQAVVATNKEGFNPRSITELIKGMFSQTSGEIKDVPQEPIKTQKEIKQQRSEILSLAAPVAAAGTALMARTAFNLLQT